MKLTAKQEMFCKEYLLDLNATASAKRAGYSEKTAMQQGERMLRNVEIQKKLLPSKTVHSKKIWT